MWFIVPRIVVILVNRQRVRVYDWLDGFPIISGYDVKESPLLFTTWFLTSIMSIHTSPWHHLRLQKYISEVEFPIHISKRFLFDMFSREILLVIFKSQTQVFPVFLRGQLSQVPDPQDTTSWHSWIGEVPQLYWFHGNKPSRMKQINFWSVCWK